MNRLPQRVEYRQQVFAMDRRDARRKAWEIGRGARLIRAREAANSFDNDGRKEATRQFVDDKTFKPGLGAYDLKS